MSTEDLKKRVSQFNTMSLPGQPMGMHMGTSYLVNDLTKAIEQLERERDELRKAIKDADTYAVENVRMLFGGGLQENYPDADIYIKAILKILRDALKEVME